MPRVSKTDVNSALAVAAKVILQGGGSDGRVSRAELAKALPSVPKEQRKLVDMFCRFVDSRDFKAGAQTFDRPSLMRSYFATMCVFA